MNFFKLINIFSIIPLSTLFLTGCSYNISMAHTEGTASDVIDDNATPTANTTATLPSILTP